ncbi:MAG: staygreen family protein [Anaerolineae bacterium]|nr:staygreen family protein [Anaerolineae bacterium]
MSVLNTAKLHVQFMGEASPTALIPGRRYTLTHSDSTGDLFLTIGSDYDHEALMDIQTRLMRDEVIGEWRDDDEGNMSLHLMCHVSSQWLNFGPAGWRFRIFEYHMPLVLQALRYGDRILFRDNQELDHSTVYVHYRSHKARYNKLKVWGKLADFIVNDASEA